MATDMGHEWTPPDWLATAAAWAASLVAAGGAKPAFDWWQGRGKDRREAKRAEIDAATELRDEMRADLRELRVALDKRDGEIEAVKREMFELVGKIAALTAENHAVRSDRHRLLNWVTVFYADLQIRWDRAGLPKSEFPGLPTWIRSSSSGPTASFQDGETPT